MSNDVIDAVELFPIRVSDVNTKAKAIKEGEVNGYNPTTRVASLPIGDNAYERTVRLHEALHAIYSPKGVPNTIVSQTAEDLRLHLNKAQLEGQPRRDEITSAVLDLRAIAGMAPYNERPWHQKEINDQLLGVFLRAVAILKGHSGWTPSSKASRYSNLIKDAYQKLDCKHKAKLGQSLKRAFDNIKLSDGIKGAVGALSKHFKEPLEPPKGGGRGRSGEGDDQQKGAGVVNPLIEATKGEGEQWMQGWGDGEFAKIKLPPDLKYVADDKIKKIIVDLTERGQMPKVNIHRLAMTHPKKSDKGPITIMAYSGAKIRAKRLAAAMTSPIPIRLFKRKRINTEGGFGGTILIDASGSMGIKDKALDELMELCPYGSIAYYDGHGTGGDIVVVAERGKQCDLKNIPIGKNGRPERHSDNTVDFQGMQWMMTQPKPWYYLTDGQFTGTCTAIAIDLLNKMLKKKDVTQVTSLKKMKNILLKLVGQPEVD